MAARILEFPSSRWTMPAPVTPSLRLQTDAYRRQQATQEQANRIVRQVEAEIARKVDRIRESRLHAEQQQEEPSALPQPSDETTRMVFRRRLADLLLSSQTA